MNKTIGFSTLGCRLNQFESDSLISDFIKNGYKVVSVNNKADAYIINTCTVTNKSDSKSRGIINKVNRLNPSALVFVTGCYAETNKDIVKNIDGVDYVIGNKAKYSLFKVVDKFLSNELVDINKIKPSLFDYNIAKDTLHTRSFIKIQDGCNENCSYCKIPIARGRAESRSTEDIIYSIKKLIDFGYKEVILTGINIGDYYNEGNDLAMLLKKVLDIPGNFRIHLSSLEPNKISHNLIDLFIHPKMCFHIHIPLQSGCDRILRLMGRGYKRDYFAGVINLIRKKHPLINITTDVMVGFPGEKENEFLETLSFLEELNLTHIHTFKFSSRKGTLAESMSNQVDGGVKSNRSLLVRELSTRLSILYLKGFLFKPLRVLVEKQSLDGFFSGYSDNYIRVKFRGEPVIGDFIEIIPTSIDKAYLIGKIKQ